MEYTLQKVRARTQPNAWACFEQHLLKGRPGAEVATELGIPANTVSVYATRVLARVRVQCSACLGDLDRE